MAHTPWLLELEDNGQVHKHLPQPSVSVPLLYERRDANRDKSGPDHCSCDMRFCGLCQHRPGAPILASGAQGKPSPGSVEGMGELGDGMGVGRKTGSDSNFSA